MTRLEELLYSLVTVIVLYHDSQPRTKKLIVTTDGEVIQEKSLQHAKQIIFNQDFNISLNEIIKQCPDNGRRPLLYYLLHEINFLKEFLDREKSLEPDSLDEYTNQIVQLFLNLKVLLENPKHKTCRINLIKTEDKKHSSINLPGLKNDGYLGGDLCNSGEILNHLVLNRFNINGDTSDDRIMEIAEQICKEHQHTLLIQELKIQNEQQKKLNLEQESKYDSLSCKSNQIQKSIESVSKKQRLALYVFYFLFIRIRAKEENQRKLIEEQKKTIEIMEKKISELTEKVAPKSHYRFY